MTYDRLFQPIEINGMQLRNRIMMPAMHHLYTENGHCTERFTEYYKRRGEGGAGLIVVGSCRFDEYGAKDNSMSLADESTVAGWQEFMKVMHETGAKVAVQLYHAGRYMPERDVPCGKPALSPSETFCPYTRETAPAMSYEQIKEVIAKYAEGAERAKRAGFDAVELGCNSGYLLNQFLSPITNLREDEYGGSWENRVRMPLEVISAVRKAVGENYPIILRLGGNDLVPESCTNTEIADFAALAEKAGVDLFNVTGGWHQSRVPQITGDLPAGGFSYLAEGIKAKVSVPVSSSNRVNDPLVAEKILAMGQADMVTMGRALLADPELPNKAKNGKSAQIRPCMGCNQGCLANTFFDRPIECLVNPLCGRELTIPEEATKETRKILVIGGGPAGMECAYRAAKRGHAVVLREKADRLGGQLLLAAKTSAHKDFERLISYYEVALDLAGAAVELSCEDALENAGRFDIIVSAVGGQGAECRIPMDDSVQYMTVEEMLTEEKIPGKNVVFIGASFVTALAAQTLARRSSISEEQLYHLSAFQAESQEKIRELLNSSSRNITIVDRLKKIGIGFESGVGWPCMSELGRLHVKKLPRTEIKKIENGILYAISEDKEGKQSEVEIKCDSLIFTGGAHPQPAFTDKIRKACPSAEVYEVGNCLKTGRAIDAIREGCILGSTL